MNKYPVPPNEQERQVALEAYKILDTLPETEYDNLAHLASFICGTPISLITLLDNNRQWFKSHPAVELSETPRDIAFCAYNILEPTTVMEVEDLRTDERFKDFPTVTSDPNLVFYAGAPLVTASGHAIGSICVLDTKPRKLTAEQKKALQSLSSQIMSLLELRKITRENKIVSDRLKRKNVLLTQFAKVAAHDLKSPLNSMTTTVDVLNSVFVHELSKEAQESLQDLKTSALQLSDLIEGIYQYSRNERLLVEQKKEINIRRSLQKITKLLSKTHTLNISLINCDHTININPVAFTQICTNLIGNAIKYCIKDNCQVTVTFSETEEHYVFSIRDDGPGIEPSDQKKIFGMFVKLQYADRFGKPSTGIGLHTVKNLIHRLGGKISVVSELGQGATFTFTIAK